MKYAVSLVLCLGLFVVMRRSHNFTFFTWAFLLVAHAPFLLLMLALERTKKIKIHPVVCFLVMWAGGLGTGTYLGRALDWVRTSA